MAYIPTQNDLRLLKQHSRNIRVRIEVLNTKFQILDEIQGEATALSLSVRADSNVRRTCNLTLIVENSSYITAHNSLLWFDRMLRCFYGIYDAANDTYVYYPLGVFLLNENSYTFDSQSRSLSLSMVDLMALATEARASAIGASKVIVEVNNNIRGAMISALTQWMSWNKYRICEFPSGQMQTPYDLEFNTGCYPYEVLDKLVTLYPCYQIYFDIDGTFVCASIPSNIDDSVVLDQTIMDEQIISESYSNSFTDVHNITEIWGMKLEADRTTETCTTSSGTYILDFDDITVLEDGVSYCFTCDADNIAGQMIQVEATTACAIKVRYDHADGTQTEENINAGVMKAGVSYVVWYTAGAYYLLGEQNIHAIAMEVLAEPDATQKAAYQTAHACNNIRYIINPKSSFAVESIGEKKQVLTGDEYESIYTTELALDRCAYENWKACRLQDGVTLKMLIIPWLDVQQKISYTSPMTGEVRTCIVDSISIDIQSGTMTIGATQFYPYYPW